MENEEAGVTLKAVGEVESRTGGTPQKPWMKIVLLSTAFGTAVFLMLQDIVWGALLLAALFVAVIIIEFSAPRNVRPAMKQSAGSGPSLSWKTAIPSVLVIALLTLLPHGHVVASLTAGAVVAAGIAWLLTRDWR